jgi:HEAT repeat protein
VTTIDLPAPFARALAELSAPQWRDRKQAAETLRNLIAGGEGDERIHAEVIERLVEGLCTGPLDGRAACQEVLRALGTASVPAIEARLARAGAPPSVVELLGELGHAGHVPLLAGIAGDPTHDANVRAAAAASLGRLGGDDAVATLRQLLRDPSEMIRVYALDALGEARAAIQPRELRDLVAAPHSRKVAATVLGQAKDPEAAVALVELLRDSMPGVRATAAIAVAALDRDLGAAAGVASALLAAPPEARERVRELVRHHDAGVRAAAIRLAHLSGDAECVPLLLEVMDDPIALERATELVAGLGARANPALLAAAESAARREYVWRLIGALDEHAVEPPLRSLLAQGLLDPSEDASSAAAEALAVVGDRSCLSALWRAMGTLGRVGEAAAEAFAAVLARAGASADGDVELIVGSAWPHEGPLAKNLARVAGALASTRWVPHLVGLLGSSDAGVRVASAQALGQLPGEHEGVGALAFALADEEPQVRAASCRSLGELRAQSACGSLLAATHDDSPLVRAAAVHAVVTLDNPVALARLRELVVEDPVPAVVVQAIVGVGRSGLEQDLTMMMSLCLSADHEVVKAAARALGGFRHHRATAALLGLLAHERWDVRWAAAEVLAQRGDATALAPLRGVLERETDALVRQAVVEAIALLEASREDG